MLSDNDIEIIVKIVNTGNDVLIEKIVEIINASLLCKDEGKVVIRTPEEEKEIQARH